MRDSVPPEAAEDLDLWLGRPDWTSERIAGDASARAYFRITLPGSLTRILAWYPPEIRADMERVVKAHDALRGHLPIPAILAQSAGALLQEDAGDLTLTALLAVDRASALGRYRDAVSLLGPLQEARGAATVNPAFDADKFTAELEMTLQFYVMRLSGVTSDAAILSLRQAFTRLARKLTRHEYILCHRDYHGQNIHVLNSEIIVFDYQDLRMGPDTYDVASLLRDRGAWRTIGHDGEEALFRHWAELRGEDPERLRPRYLECLLQRSIKAVGTFARMAVVYGRCHYLEYVSPTLETARECVEALGEWPELREHFPWHHEPA
ncbi:MAG: phosphotransferase [Acidobacteria bacterium]|nr:phosphotransferase [Acidobacteriota bacterium]